MMAKTTRQGTAASETALCPEHDTPENRAAVEAQANADVTGQWIDATGNDELQCVMHEPDFVDVHVTLDWVIRVHGTTDPERGKDIASDYVADQSLHALVEMVAHEDGTVCDGDEDRLTEEGFLPEDELTVALYPEGTELPTSIPVAVSTYGYPAWVDAPNPGDDRA